MNYTISYSFKYKAEDKFNKQHNSLKPEGGILACHRSCVSSQHHIDRYVRNRKQVEENDNSVEKIACKSICHTFSFRNIVYFVEKNAKILIQKIHADRDLIILLKLS